MNKDWFDYYYVNPQNIIYSIIRYFKNSLLKFLFALSNINNGKATSFLYQL